MDIQFKCSEHGLLGTNSIRQFTFDVYLAVCFDCQSILLCRIEDGKASLIPNLRVYETGPPNITVWQQIPPSETPAAEDLMEFLN